MLSSLEEKPRGETLRFQLRSGTRAEHDSLDGHPSFAALMAGTLDLDGYREIMIALHDLYRRFDAPLAEACHDLRVARFGFVYQRREAILAEDLEALGVAGTPADRMAGIRWIPRIGTLETLAGALYVIEGSVLGGAVMCRAAEAVTREAGLAGTGYWAWCRDAGAGRWAMTCRLLEAVSASGASTEAMIEAARATFRAISDRLAPCQAVPLEGSHDRCQTAPSI